MHVACHRCMRYVDAMLTRKQRQIGVALVVALLALALAYFGTLGRAPAPPLALEKLSIALPALPHAALLHIAAAKGFFSEEGLDVTLMPVSHGKAAIDLLAQGKADLATAAEAPFVLAVMKGADFSIVASVLNLSFGSAIVARRDHGIVAPRDLLGKKVGVTFGTTADYFLWAFLIRHKLAPASVTLLDIEPAQLQYHLAKGSIDAIASWQPIVSDTVAALGENGATFNVVNMYTETQVVIGHSDFLKGHPQALEKLLRALLKAEHFARDQPEQALKLVAERLKIDSKVLQPVWSNFDFTLELPQAQLIIMEDEARWAMARGYVAKGPLPNFLPHLYLDALLTVLPERVTVVR